jgi:hypothetical protein
VLFWLPVDDLWDNDQEALWNRLLEGASSPLCEVLGLQQRQWLQGQLQDSNAALRVIGSGSVLAGWCRDMGSCNHVLDCAYVLAGSVACFTNSWYTNGFCRPVLHMPHLAPATGCVLLNVACHGLDGMPWQGLAAVRCDPVCLGRLGCQCMCMLTQGLHRYVSRQPC